MFRVERKTQFQRRFQVGSDQLIFFKVIAPFFVGEGQGRIADGGNQYFLFMEEDITAADTDTGAYAEAGICFKREIEHEVKIRAPVKTLDIGTIRRTRPVVITELEHKMICGALGEIQFTPVFFGFGGGRRGCGFIDDDNGIFGRSRIFWAF